VWERAWRDMHGRWGEAGPPGPAGPTGPAGPLSPRPPPRRAGRAAAMAPTEGSAPTSKARGNMETVLASGRFQRRMGLETLKAFCHENRFTLRGYLPTRKYLSNAGRIDLASVIRNNGGPRAVARALGLSYGMGAGPVLSEEGAEGSKEAQGGLTGQTADAPSTAASGGGAEIFSTEDPALFASVEDAVGRDLVFVVEHRKGDRAPADDGARPDRKMPWVLFKSQKSLGDARVTANSLLAEARICCATYPGHRVRLTALDSADRGKRLTFEIALPDERSL